MPELPDHLKWRIIPLSAGAVLEGWLAGPVVPVACHWTGKRSVPCRRLITDGKMRCWCEDKPASVRVIGYAPIIDKARDRYVVILSAAVAHKVERIKAGSAVRLTRPKAVKRPLFVTQLPDDYLGSDQTKKMRAGAIHDICPYLLHVWQDQELTESFGLPFFKSLGSDNDESAAAAA